MIICIIRSILYLFTASECFILSFLYKQGTLRYNPTSQVIKYLQLLFLSLGAMFTFMAFIPIVKTLNTTVYDAITNILTIFVAVVLYFLIKFRESSIKKKGVK